VVEGLWRAIQILANAMAGLEAWRVKVKDRSKKPVPLCGVSKYVINRIKSMTSETASHLVAISLTKYERDFSVLLRPLLTLKNNFTSPKQSRSNLSRTLIQVTDRDWKLCYSIWVRSKSKIHERRGLRK
jgi:hypothetical protein